MGITNAESVQAQLNLLQARCTHFVHGIPLDETTLVLGSSSGSEPHEAKSLVTKRATRSSPTGQLIDQRSKSLDEDNALKKYLRDIGKIPRISVEDEQVLGHLIQSGDQSAIEKLVKANLRFVVTFAKRYRGLGLSFLDLINEGNVGLIEAAKRFDPGKKVKFITYAVWWIRQSILIALYNLSGPFRLPGKTAKALFRIGKMQARLYTELQRQPSVEEVAEAMSLDPEDVAHLLQVSVENVSLSAMIDEEHEFHLYDKLSDKTFIPPDDLIDQQERAQLVRRSLSVLNEQEREVIIKRFGLGGRNPMTLKEVGDTMSLSRERIRQVEASALKRLHQHHKLSHVLQCVG